MAKNGGGGFGGNPNKQKGWFGGSEKKAKETPISAADAQFGHYAETILKARANRLISPKDAERFRRFVAESMGPATKEKIANDLAERNVITPDTVKELSAVLDSFERGDAPPIKTEVITSTSLPRRKPEPKPGKTEAKQPKPPSDAQTAKERARALPRVKPVIREVAEDAREAVDEAQNGIGRELARFDKKTRERIIEFQTKNVGLFVQLAIKINDLEAAQGNGRDLETVKIEEEIEKTHTDLERKLSKDKKLRADLPPPEELRELFQKFAKGYVARQHQFAAENGPAPETHAAKVELYRSLLNKYLIQPDRPITTKNPVVAHGQAGLQQIPRPGKTPTRPRGSGFVSFLESKGVRIGGELALTYMDTMLTSVGISIALATYIFGPQYVAANFVRFISIGVSAVLCFVFNLSFKNELNSNILQLGQLRKAAVATARRKPVSTAAIVGTIGLATMPSFNTAISASVTSAHNSAILEQAFHDTEEKARTMVQATETNLPANERTQSVNIEHLFDTADQTFDQYAHTLGAQVNAGLDVEQFPNHASLYETQFPGMTFGQSGGEGAGPHYHAKRSLFLGEQFDDAVPQSYRDIVSRARADAGLHELGSGRYESLQEAQTRMYHEYLEAITAPVVRPGDREHPTESHRDRIIRIVHHLRELAPLLAKQNVASEIGDAVRDAKPPILPQELVVYQRQLREEIGAVNESYNAFLTNAQHSTQLVQEASNQLVDGSHLSLSIPRFSMADALNPIMIAELDLSDPRKTELSEQLAHVLGGRPADYAFVAGLAIDSEGLGVALFVTLFPTLLTLPGALRRGRRTREDQEHHEQSLEETEEAAVDYWMKEINEHARFFVPGAPEYTRVRVRLALREFIATKAHELADSSEAHEHVKHWVLNEFSPMQLSEDVKVMRSVEEVLNKLRYDPEYGEQFYEMIFPGFTKLAKALENDAQLLAKVASGQGLNDKEAQTLKQRFKNKASFEEHIDKLRLEAAYANLDREAADADVEYKCLETILADIKVGADTYNVFTDGAVREGTQSQNRGITKIINSYQYGWSVSMSANRTSEVRGPAQAIDTEHMTVMRQVARETAGAGKVQEMMAANRKYRDELGVRLKDIDTKMTRFQLTRPDGTLRSLAVPKSLLQGEYATLRDRLAAGSGFFTDVAKDVRRQLEGTSRASSVAEKGGPQYAVNNQLDAMAQEFFSGSVTKRSEKEGWGPEKFRKFLDEINEMRSPAEQLSMDLRLVYSAKAQPTSVEGYELDVPGFSLRLRLLNARKEEFRIDSDGNVVPATEDARADDQDFQMSHALSVDTEPMGSAKIFTKWASGAFLKVATKARKQWLREHYVHLDADQERESRFKLPKRRADAEAWLDDFYSRKVLDYKRATYARSLLQKNRIIPADLAVFKKGADPTYGRVPPRELVKRVLDTYYSRASREGLGGLPALGTRMRGLELDLSEEGKIENGKKPVSLGDYVVRRGRLP